MSREGRSNTSFNKASLERIRLCSVAVDITMQDCRRSKSQGHRKNSKYLRTDSASSGRECAKCTACGKGAFSGSNSRDKLTSTPSTYSLACRWKNVLPARQRQFSITRSEEHTSELQSLMRLSYAVFCSTQKIHKNDQQNQLITHH